MKKKKSTKNLGKSEKAKARKRPKTGDLEDSTDDGFGTVTLIKVGTSLTTLDVLKAVYAGPSGPH